MESRIRQVEPTVAYLAEGPANIRVWSYSDCNRTRNPGSASLFTVPGMLFLFPDCILYSNPESSNTNIAHFNVVPLYDKSDY